MSVKFLSAMIGEINEKNKNSDNIELRLINNRPISKLKILTTIQIFSTKTALKYSFFQQLCKIRFPIGNNTGKINSWR